MQKKKPYHPPHIYLAQKDYFITGSTFDKQPIWDTDNKKSLLKETLKSKISEFGLKLHGWVILSNHYHLLLRNSERDTIWKFMKGLHGASATTLNKLEGRTGRRIWRNYWDRCPRGERDFYGFFNYIHLNPWKHGLIQITAVQIEVVENRLVMSEELENDFLDFLASYPFSSFCFYLKKYGHEGMWDYFRQYPVLAHFDGDEF